MESSLKQLHNILFIVRDMPQCKFIVTGIVRGGRQDITKPLSKNRAMNTKKELQRSMKIAIPKYRWIKGLKIKKVCK